MLADVTTFAESSYTQPGFETPVTGLGEAAYQHCAPRGKWSIG